jgi:N-methylhydantoinase B
MHQADPITTEVTRHALAAAAEQMRAALVRTSVSPIIYEGQDFACAIYDRNVRLLAQAETLPIFVGAMSFCIEAAVAAVGGPGALESGDVLLYNVPYGSGAHAQDAAIIQPVFLGSSQLIGYAVTKAHWGDIGGKSAYATNTTDVHQEGVCFPGVKLYRSGELVDDIFRIILANSRMPDALRGDIHAQAVSTRTGAVELMRIVDQLGLDVFEACVERMLDHAEAATRAFVSALPAGRFEGTGHLDNDGLTDEPIEFAVTVEITGSEITFDFRQAPPAVAGPLNCPLPTTICAARIAVAMLAGNGEMPNEGTFRPVRVLTSPGSIFHPLPPSPCYMYAWPAIQAMDAVNQAISRALQDVVPAGDAGDVCGVLAFGYQPETHEPFVAGVALPCGQGAHARGDGATLFTPSISHATLPSTEFMEIKFPVLFERVEFMADSAGPGKYRGGMGLAYDWRPLVDVDVFCTIDRTKAASWGQQGGLSGLPNAFAIEYPDGHQVNTGKVTAKRVPAGSVLRITCGGGGGYGRPEDRSREALAADLADGLVTHKHAITHYHRELGESHDGQE